jgi:hypothetical protein
VVDGFEYLSICFFVFRFVLVGVGMFVLRGLADGFADRFARFGTDLSSHFE